MTTATIDRTAVKTTEDFANFTAMVKEREDFFLPAAWGIGIAAIGREGETVFLDTRFLSINYCTSEGAWAVIFEALCPAKLPENEESVDPTTSLVLSRAQLRMLPAFLPFWHESGHDNIDAIRDCQRVIQNSKVAGVPVLVVIPDLNQPVVDSRDVYLRLHLLSKRLVIPNSINLDGIFGLLPNVAWTDRGPILASQLASKQREYAVTGHPLYVHGVDKFPRMTDYVIPSGVRIADANRVRLGAYLAEGTTVMHEGFCNFNAGTLGACMVEGRISSGVIVGAHTDIGGGASIMGTLSGGGKEVVSIGEHCLLGANSGIGISLGDYCRVEAGLYVTPKTPISVFRGTPAQWKHGLKAKDLSGQSGLTFYRNGSSGRVEVKPTKVDGVPIMNEALHANT